MKEKSSFSRSVSESWIFHTLGTFSQFQVMVTINGQRHPIPSVISYTEIDVWITGQKKLKACVQGQTDDHYKEEKPYGH